MKILMVAMFSNHFFRWVEQLKETNHEIVWIDVFDSNTNVSKIDFVDQVIGWRNKWNYPGRYWLKAHMPLVSDLINNINQRDLQVVVENKIQEFNPDLVHSFVMYSSSVPLLKVMKKYSHIKWAYSAWGNDLFYYQNIPSYRKGMKEVFPYLDYMFADCNRDFHIAESIGFSGEYLGTYPTGGGYDFNLLDPAIQNRNDKNIILIKGYEHKFGRCINILRGLLPIKKELEKFEIVIFGSSPEVIKFVATTELKDWKNLKILGNLLQDKVLQLMGKSLIYIGNSISDGMPNTLLEAIIMETFPIQSNPGGATEEIIRNDINGFLIKNPRDTQEIMFLVQKALSNLEFVNRAIDYNKKNVKPKLEREKVKNEVLKKYELIQSKL